MFSKNKIRLYRIYVFKNKIRLYRIYVFKNKIRIFDLLSLLNNLIKFTSCFTTIILIISH